MLRDVWLLTRSCLLFAVRSSEMASYEMRMAIAVRRKQLSYSWLRAENGWMDLENKYIANDL